MAVSKRVMAVVLVVIALALTVTGVVLAATDSNPGGLAKDPLTLNGYPPTSANVLVTLSTGADFGMSANVAVNFKNDRVDAIVHFPLVVTNAAIELRLMKNRIFARSANESSGPWLYAHLTTPDLYGYALELTRPDIKLITGFQESETKSGYATTYVFFRNNVALTSLLGSSATSSILGSVRWSITVGSEGEVTKSVVVVRSHHATTTLSATVLSYNHAASIAVPSDVKPISVSILRQLLSSENFASLLIPRDLSSLSRASIS